VNPLGDLPPSVASNPSSLPARNLLRGASMGLPSGQAVAEAMGFKPIPDEQLKVGKANEDDTPAIRRWRLSPTALRRTRRCGITSWPRHSSSS